MTNKVINKNMIFLDKKYNNKDEIIDYILNHALNEELITGIEELREAIINRENQISTAVGFDVAMPHGKANTVIQPFISFLRTENSFRWSKENRETVRMIILIAVPEGDVENVHLKIISEISRKLLDDEFREKLLLEKNNNEVYNLLNSINN